ncbi:cell death-inducing p53-target protein 1-like [Rhinatrema bivittatum]|uniref:cell death-inducing p53-target protein 1-like n=1 Tax=Rhinatrema bivittatum TaxID=194408 RepID=UPI00112C43CA|nr:cell death-inducing p53-target protein 1-like [Rhinatrema bivittatum]
MNEETRVSGPAPSSSDGNVQPLLQKTQPAAMMSAAYLPPPPYQLEQTTTVSAVQIQPAANMTTVIVGTNLTDTPAVTVCPACQQNVTTKINHATGMLTWIIFLILCLIGCWLGCCLIPFFVKSCKDVDHYCPNCNHHIYKYKRV